MTINESIFEQYPILSSSRLTLRDIRLSDAREILAMRANGRVNQFIPRPTMQTEEEAVALIEKTNEAYKNRIAIGWAGVLRENEAIVGTCGFNSIDAYNLRAEIGGELDVNYWGKNIALEAVSLIVQFGLETMNLHTIEAKVSPNNRGAIYLMEQFGFVKEAHFKDRVYVRGAFDDMAVYTLLKGNEKYYLGS